MKNLLASSALAFAFLVAAPASAAVITQYIGADISTDPYTIDLGTGSLTFSTVDPSFFAFNPTGVATTGSAEVYSLGEPFFRTPTPSSFFTNRGGSFGPSLGGLFAAYPTPVAIPFSITDGLVGFRFTLNNDLHYGYAQVGGSFLTGFRYESTPGTDLALGEISAVPEPSAWALMIVGFGLTGFALRRRRSAPGAMALAHA
ncbi:PEPxxWA-CTERM sorting domain-containing protein [Phenylobacterium sp.]|uniref:PEPxxWA-CTERM sorting domain-containing protein n=1 Tax=Phenylobacterium sp. TaxID=1871053 RepID=UPI00286BE7B2|nr:PEPxxWA-CTERM sorting domain-containing protein [Phenylobacterium sp.]